LLEQSRQNYNAGDFVEAERLAREALEQLQREYGAQPNFRIPSPGGFQETRFSIPLIFEFYRSYTAPSEVTRLVASERVPFNTLFNEMVARISGNLSGFEITSLPTQLHNRFGGCLYFGNSGYSCTNTSSFSRFEDLLGDNPELREQFPVLFQLEEEPQELIGQYSEGINDDLHSLLKDTLALIQKSLVAQEEGKGIEALVFAEMSRNTEFVRLAPLVLYGLLNYDAIASNPSYSRFFGSVGLSNLDLNSIRRIASREDATIIYYSTLASEPNEDLLIWVIQPSGSITFKKVELSNSEVPLNSLIARGYTAAASFIDRGQQETALIQAVRNLRSQGYERERASASDFLIDEATQTSRLQALYNTLIKPVEELLPTDPESQVIFVPHKSLTAVPFAALQDSEGQYVIEKHTIRMTHSLSNLKNPIEPIEDMPNADEFLAVGNPDSRGLNLTYSDGSRLNLSNLPAADSEVEDISSDAYWFRREAATWRRISPWIKNAKIIHLATHGILNFDNRKEFMLVQLLEEGQNKSLYIEQDKRNIASSSDFEYRLWYDQVSPDKSWQVAQASLNLPGAIILADLALTAEQILSLQLSADLVVLSACNSGRGVPTESGILGLPFALGLAGVPRVVVSQWSVPDASTRLLMISYYNAMRENIRLYGEANPPAALRKAMLEIKDFEYYQDPIYWAGFTTIDVAY
jgi:CHAT domain-containing protein